jgi:hypothetical protein
MHSAVAESEPHAVHPRLVGFHRAPVVEIRVVEHDMPLGLDSVVLEIEPPAIVGCEELKDLQRTGHRFVEIRSQVHDRGAVRESEVESPSRRPWRQGHDGNIQTEASTDRVDRVHTAPRRVRLDSPFRPRVHVVGEGLRRREGDGTDPQEETQSADSNHHGMSLRHGYRGPVETDASAGDVAAVWVVNASTRTPP